MGIRQGALREEGVSQAEEAEREGEAEAEREREREAGGEREAEDGAGLNAREPTNLLRGKKKKKKIPPGGVQGGWCRRALGRELESRKGREPLDAGERERFMIFWLDSSARGFGERVTALDRAVEIGELLGRTVVIPDWAETLLRLFDRSLSLPHTHTYTNEDIEGEIVRGREEGGREGGTGEEREGDCRCVSANEPHTCTH